MTSVQLPQLRNELQEEILVFPFRLLSLKQSRLQEVPSHSVVLFQRHLLPVCPSPESFLHLVDSSAQCGKFSPHCIRRMSFTAPT